MNLIFIYGPPATGKLTVAKELAKKTNYKIFHNHLTVDLLLKFFKYGDPDFFSLNSKLRTTIFDGLAKSKLKGLIFTYCYAYKEDNQFVKKVIRTITKNKGKVKFVHLFTDKKTLNKRVKGASRENFDKIKSKKVLNNALEKWELFKPIPFVKSLSIDNTNIKPKTAAEMIKKHYKL